MFVLFLNIDVAILFIYTTVILQFHKDHEYRVPLCTVQQDKLVCSLMFKLLHINTMEPYLEMRI